jgi:hypothetical protein
MQTYLIGPSLGAVMGALILPAPASLAAPAAGADPAAYALLKAAHENRQTFGADFPGLAADLVFNDDGQEHAGALRYKPGEGGTGVRVTLDGATPEAQSWVQSTALNLLGHRRGGDFDGADGRHPLTFGPDDKSPLGRLVHLNDDLKSSYRVKDGIVTEVTRTMGDTRFTITVLETTPVERGRYLPRHFVVTYFDARTGAIRSVQSFTDVHRKISGVWIPTARRVIEAEDGKISVRGIALGNLRLLARPAAVSVH